jgi:bifunctional non-homologous end joining protein LigD
MRAKSSTKRPRTNHRPAEEREKSARADATAPSVTIPQDHDTVDVRIRDKIVRLTNMRKIFWPERGITKGDLIQYYTDIAPALLPHLADRAMVMKRYPNGVSGEFFFMKRAPSPRPDWIETCSIKHGSGNIIDFPMVQDLASLLWVVNLGCIDLNQWYARCDDVDRPDYLHFDLDPVKGTTWDQVVSAASLVHDALNALEMPSYIKTTGSRGFHVYVPIERGPTQKEVWAFAKQFAFSLASLRPNLLTAEYRIAKRPRNRVLVDYNQNAWGQTLASVYSVRPQAQASVSTPITWQELESGVRIEDFRIDNVPARVKKMGDLWAPLLSNTGRARLEPMSGIAH